MRIKKFEKSLCKEFGYLFELQRNLWVNKMKGKKQNAVKKKEEMMDRQESKFI